MQKTYFLDGSVVVASIMYTKNKHFGETYVSMKERHIVSELLRKLFFTEGLNITILDTMNSEYFEILDGIIIMNSLNKCSLQDIKDAYKESILIPEVFDIMWDDSLIFNYLLDIKEDNKNLNFEPAKIEEIIDCILDNSTHFYESIACELSKEEYEYLKRKVEIKSCKNCNSYCSGRSKGYVCDGWSNDELVGRAKVKKLY